MMDEAEAEWATQLVMLQFTDPAGKLWHAAGRITRLRPSATDPGVTESRQLVEGDGMKCTGIKVVINDG